MVVSKEVSIGQVRVGGLQPHFLIAGPCVIESEKLAMETAEMIAAVTQDLGIPYVYKSSYDKANRTSISSFRGLGQERGLAILKKVKDEVKIPVLTDIHAIHEVRPAADVVGCPFKFRLFLCRQTDLLVEAAKTGCVVNVKKRAIFVTA